MPARSTRSALALLGAAAATVTALAAPGSAAAAPSVRTVVTPFGCHHARSAHSASCFGELLSVRNSSGGLSPMTTTSPSGYGPADIQAAYRLSGSSAGNRTGSSSPRWS